MHFKIRGRVARAASLSCRGLGAARRAFANMLLLALLAVLVVGFLAGRVSVPRGAALVIAPRGEIVEQLTAPPRRLLFSTVGAKETLLKDLLDAIEAAKDDKRVSSLYLDLSHMGPCGLTKLEDLRRAVDHFRAHGKKVVAYAEHYNEWAYAVAADADEIWLHPFGAVILQGLGRWRTYYKEGLDRLGMDVHVYRVGEYKSAVEPFLRSGPSPEAVEADRKWLTDLWSTWLEEVAGARKLTPADLSAYVEEMPDRLDKAGGDLARLALESRLVDRLGYLDEVRSRMIEIAGKADREKTFRQISVRDYLRATGANRNGGGRGPAVAVVVAKGDILDGRQPAGTIGGDSTAKLIRQAREDGDVKAIVLRVDSPGGSAFASEVIRRELALARENGKPVVVSMGSLAASGGYWIATASDEIWASPVTITGSIGIFAMFPTLDRPLARYLGVHVDGVGTTRLSGALRIDRPVEPEVGRMLQSVINRSYQDFLVRVAEARKMSPEAVDRIARGRVWSGKDALDRKLVDKLGSLEDAIASAAARAKLPENHRVLWIEEERSLASRLVFRLMRSGTRMEAALGLKGEGESQRPIAHAPLVRALAGELDATERLLRLNDPLDTYALCPIEVP